MCGKMKFDGAMARALYDNVPESPEELAFRKGDILMVIEQDTGGLQGWWLCTLHGRQGIAPGNRLQLLEALPPQHTHHSPGSGKQEGLYQVPLGKQVHQVPQSSKVVTPMCMGQSYTYDQPLPIRQELYDVPSVRLQGVASGLPGQLYDTPPIAHEVYSVPPCRSAAAPHEGSYDFPQPLRLKPGGIYDVPPSLVTHVSPGVALNKGVLSSGGGVYDIPPAQQSAGGQWEAYDIPRGTPPLQKKGVQLPREVTDGISHLSLASSGTSSWNVSYGEADAILRRVAGLQRAANNAVQVMLGQAASPRWRTVSFMEQHGAELRATADSLHVVLADLLLLGRRAMGGGSVTSQSGPQGKLRRQLHRLDDSLQIMQQSSRALDSAGWDLAVLAPPDKPSGRSDDLDRLLMVCRSVPDDVKQLASTLVGNWELLFRDRGGQQDWELPHESEPPTPPFPVTGDQWEDEVPAVSPEQGVSSWMEDYDYVHLQGKEEFERQQQELLDKENIVSKVPLEEEQ
ncbi:enhancer of filamentation 1-like, partial [Arapaima gigas]